MITKNLRQINPQSGINNNIFNKKPAGTSTFLQNTNLQRTEKGDTVSFKGTTSWLNSRQISDLVGLTLKNLHNLDNPDLPQRVAKEAEGLYNFKTAPLARQLFGPILDPISSFARLTGEVIGEVSRNTGLGGVISHHGDKAFKAGEAVIQLAEEGLEEGVGAVLGANPVSQFGRLIYRNLPEKRCPSDNALVVAARKIVKHTKEVIQGKGLPGKPIDKYTQDEVNSLKRALPEIFDRIINNPTPHGLTIHQFTAQTNRFETNTRRAIDKLTGPK